MVKIWSGCFYETRCINSSLTWATEYCMPMPVKCRFHHTSFPLWTLTPKFNVFISVAQSVTAVVSVTFMCSAEISVHHSCTFGENTFKIIMVNNVLGCTHRSHSGACARYGCHPPLREAVLSWTWGELSFKSLNFGSSCMKIDKKTQLQGQRAPWLPPRVLDPTGGLCPHAPGPRYRLVLRMHTMVPLANPGSATENGKHDAHIMRPATLHWLQTSQLHNQIVSTLYILKLHLTQID